VLVPLGLLLGATAVALAAAAFVGASAARLGGVSSAVALLLGVLALWVLLVRHLLARYVLAPVQQARETTKALVRANKLAATGQLAAGIAHEVGNPLSAIANYAHLVRQRTEHVPNVHDPLDGIDREVERVDRIVRGLLDFARPRHHTPRAVVADDVIRDALRLVSDQGVLRRIEVQAALGSDGAEVFAEHHDLQQVFVNLMLNAVDAMSGAGQLSIRTRRLPADVLRAVAERRRVDDDPGERFPHEPNVRARTWLAQRQWDGPVLQIVIADSGPGVPPQDVDRVFDPFYSTKGEGRGTGLGLAIVAQTVDGLGGTVWVQRAREGGAAIVMLLPTVTAKS
jgi:signal transduction histidine kinase